MSVKSKFTAACLAVLMLATWFTVGCSMGFHAEKHTGPARLQCDLGSNRYQFLRANSELFVMDMRESPYLKPGDRVSDITYYDDSSHRVFVKASGYQPKAAQPAKTIPSSGTGVITCFSNTAGDCEIRSVPMCEQGIYD